MAHRSHSCSARRETALPSGHARPRNRISNRDGPSRNSRFHASGGWRRPGADRHGSIRAGGLSHRVCRSVRLRSDGPLGQKALRRGDQRGRWSRASGSARSGGALWRRSQDGWRLRGRGWPIHRLRPFLRRLVSESAERDRPLRFAGAHRDVLAGMERSVSRCRSLDRSRQTLAHHAQGFDLRPVGRDRRCGDHVPSRAARRRSELGLPLLLAAGRHIHDPGFVEARISRGSARVAGLACPGDRRKPAPSADHVWGGRRAMAAGIAPALAAGLRELFACADRKRGQRSDADRCLRRDRGRDVSDAQGRHGAARAQPNLAAADLGLSRGSLAAAG